MQSFPTRPHHRNPGARKRALSALVLGCLLTAGLSSCDSSRVYERNLPVGKDWSWGQANRYEVLIRDTLSPYHLFVNVRHEERYAYANLWLQIRTIGPLGDTLQARVEIPLAELDGTWRGECQTSMCLQRELIGPAQRFPRAGTYVFELEQDMRENPLPGIRDVGIRLEKVESDPSSMRGEAR
jgi:gliding motility-associated lipoprotein GldH